MGITSGNGNPESALSGRHWHDVTAAPVHFYFKSKTAHAQALHLFGCVLREVKPDVSGHGSPYLAIDEGHAGQRQLHIVLEAREVVAVQKDCRRDVLARVHWLQQ